MRLLVCLAVLLALAPAHVMAEEPTPARPLAASPCETRDSSFDTKEIRCAIPVAGHAQRFRLTVTFSGGHDDTNARMTLHLDEDDLNCDAGSKTRLVGEDGDISLICLFSVPARTQGLFVLRSDVTWSHAQYTGHVFEAL